MPHKNSSPATLGGRRRKSGGKTSKKWAAIVAPRDATPVQIADVALTVASAYVDVSFDQAVLLEATPAWPVHEALPVSAQAISPQTVRLQYDHDAILSGVTMRVPFMSPGVRNASGGFVVSQAMTLYPAAQRAASQEREPMSIKQVDAKRAA